MTTETAAKPIRRLHELPKDWISKGPLARALAAAPHLIRGLDLEAMAGGVFDWPEYNRPEGCLYSSPCTADANGAHSAQVMSPLLVASHVGEQAHNPVVDGLAPEAIRFIKAHGVAWFDMSNRDMHQSGKSRPGDSRSYGGVIVRVHSGVSKRGRTLRFIVAFSGAAPWRDEELATLVGGAIVADLIEAGYVTLILPDSETFVIGADPKAVAALANTSS